MFNRPSHKPYGASSLAGVLICFTLLCTALTAQTGPQVSNPPQTQADGNDPGTKPGVFYDKTLDLSFNYPVEMRTLDMTADMETGHSNIYGNSGQNDKEHQEAKRCMRPLLDAELPQDKAPHRMANLDGVWVEDSEEYKKSAKPQPIFAKVILVELDSNCLPKKLRNNENDVLGNMALSAVAVPGIQRMPNPIWYEIGTQKIHMNSGAGRPVVNGQLDPAPIMIMSMATQWRGHLVEWVFTSNDTEIFNEITKSVVRFGDGPWAPMFPANIGPKGSGTPVTILPK
jgi:hypothetical protein